MLPCFNRGDDYQLHTSCISEDQKYGGKGYVAKPNKGQAKQEAWTEVKCLLLTVRAVEFAEIIRNYQVGVCDRAV